MKIKYKEKPTSESVDRYISILEKYLSALDVTLKLEVYDSPNGPLEEGINDVPITRSYLWLGKMEVISSNLGDTLEIIPPRLGLDANISVKSIWDDAIEIQNAIYNKLNISITNMNDPYWKLWDHIENIK
ncbi:MAG: hypothetical protein GW939_03325 [Candidatus Magasanikbacteria bacterium]|uniref:Uncharacterized protein n=1 Tax=Candidatus Magasanikbacteria bacterium CG10_big_fil_rev_8_21_14_0_10_38_6 TaxID=1974647 RepID=A0A2M6P0K3_9BACT|nr:hypothetical protein [Candidatus Magasanikbacteria bacterium]NCS72113.1 hypothetical protein [Candidatus Magasanikbacteria bacterium]PIR77089.1 MAG: hypothetical protein COU30_04315 [Candidatus Magasanikbacteria bacterium CG10_big_fil_rev_8_21_14_0_10_38_6]